MASLTPGLLFLTVFIALLPLQVGAFGAGDIPDFAFLNDKAFRHGDIENILTEIAKTAGGVVTGGGILQFAQSVVAAGSGGSKFSKSDVKKVYFGNWLRDYSQAMDIAGLSKLSADTLVLVVSVLGFMTFGFATEEFEVTADRLGVYLPVEHIDNPKGYAEKEGDARQFHPKLRPPVNPQELEIDIQTGMKNYMATENRGWDTSTALIRRTLLNCIEHGRRAGGSEGAELWEAYRLLGTALHTLEDLLAHSNWCEIGLRKMGYKQVFCHVGDRVLINTPNGSAPPLVTGTFGGADFLHSLMGEATDKLSQSSITDLSQKIDDASNADQSSALSVLKDVLSKIPQGGGSSQMDEAESLQAESKAYHFDPDNVAPPEVQKRLLAMLKWHDDVVRSVSEKIEAIPGLETLLDNLSDALNAYVYTVLAPWLSPILKEATSTLSEGSKVVIDSADQYEVFDRPNASDPSHSLLSKDHFALILNEPAGKIAQVVVQYTVKLIVNAWSDDQSDPNGVINQVLEAFYHPYFNTGRSNIQNEMFGALERWVNDLEDREQTLEALTKENVRCGKNKRQGSEDDTSGTVGGAYGQSQNTYGSGGQQFAGSTYTSSQSGGYGRQESGYEQQDPGRYETSSYRGGGQSQSRTDYGRSRVDERQTHGSAYEDQSRQDNSRRGERRDYDSPRQTSYGREESYEGRTRDSDYQGGYRASQGRTEPVVEQRNTYEEQTYGRGESYREDYSRGQRQEERRSSADRSERQQRYGEPEEQSYRARQSEGESRQGYGAYPRSDDSARRQEYDVRTSPQRGGDEYRGGDNYGEPQESYGRGEYGRSGGSGYEDSRRGQYEVAEDEGYGRRSEGYRRNEESEETFGAERLNLNEGEGDGGYSRRREYGGDYEQEGGGYQRAEY
ncbi:Het-C-domain-containing protein [Lactarius sanguifluus]|nr:Het-C-domain-containing protein [Lactarius sanguifluus]